MWWWSTRIGFVHLLQARIDEAIAWLEKAKSLKPEVEYAHWFLAAAYAFKGKRERARAELAEGLRAHPKYHSVASFRASSEWWYYPAVRDRWETVIFPGLRAAGLPEE
jgi:tetratricopeptide (TPR) repeat protein